MKKSVIVVLTAILSLVMLAQPRALADSVSTSTGPPTGIYNGSQQPSTEIVGLRSAHSRTYAVDGHYSTQIFANAINFKNASGAWTPIDDTLVASATPGFAYETKANRYSAQFPPDISSGPVHFALGSNWVNLSLAGVQGPGTASGNSDTYLIPGATVAFTAETDQLKETLSLQGPNSPSTLTYQVQASPGLTVSQNAAGGIDFASSGGHVVFSFAPPYMYDQAGATSQNVSLHLAPGANGPTVTLTADPAWLADPARQWPVVIDPTVSLGGTTDCNMVSGASANTSYCATSPAKIGWDGTSDYRYLLKFDLSSIPTNATILNSELDLHYYTGGSSTQAVGLYQLTRPWTSSATWNTYNGTSAWTNAGGDFNAPAVSSVSNVLATSSGWDRWFLTQLTQGWVNGSIANNGVLFKEPTENVRTVVQFYADKASIDNPYLQVSYDYWLGQQSFYTMAGTAQLDDRMDIGVNVANGNLVVHESDLNMPGIGLPLAIDRSYNSLDTPAGGLPTLTDFGNNWTMGTGADVGLTIYNDGSAAFHAPSGYQIPFTENADGSFTAPPAIDATLVKNSDGTYTLTFHDSGEQYNFTSGGYLTSDVDASGNKLTFGYITGSYVPELLSTITDTQGRKTTFTYNSYGGAQVVQKITDPAGRVYQYAYDPSHNLTTYTDPDNYQTKFSYDANNRLVQITDPNSNETKFAYDGSNRITSTTRVTNSSSGAGYITAFTYNPSSTTVTTPNGGSTTYTYDQMGRVTDVRDPLGNQTNTSWTSDSHTSQIVDPSGTATSQSYNSNNVMTAETTSLGQSATAQYNAQQPYQPSSMTNTSGNTTQYAYNAAGEPTSITDGSGRTTDYSYNGNGTPASLTEASGRTVSYHYNSVGLLNSVTVPSPDGAEQYTYTSSNTANTATDGDGNVTSYAYDSLDRVTRISYSDGSAIGYTYDGDGNLISEVQTSGSTSSTTSFAYDALNRRTSKVNPDGSALASTWDGDGNLITKSDAGGTISYHYNAADEVTGVTDELGNVTNIAYDGAGNRTSIKFPNGLTWNATYDWMEMSGLTVTNSSGAVLVSRSYGYTDPVSQAPTLSVYTESDQAGTQMQFTYDGAGRLNDASVTSGGGQAEPGYSYTYDQYGALASVSGPTGSQSMTYDASGNLAGDGTNTYTYDPAGRRTASSNGWAFQYNASGQLTSLTSPGSAATGMTYSGQDEWERSGSGLATYQYDSTGLRSKATAGDTTYFVSLPDGTPISMRNASGTYYYVLDRTDSVIGLTDASGTLVESIEYDPLGRVIGSAGPIDPTFGWMGSVRDASGLDLLANGYYDPVTGSYTTAGCQAPLAGHVHPSGVVYGNCGSSFIYVFKGPGFGITTFTFGAHSTAGPIYRADYTVTWKNWSFQDVGSTFSGSDWQWPSSNWSDHRNVSTGGGLIFVVMTRLRVLVLGTDLACFGLMPSDWANISWGRP